ncbi:outer membrane lipoprotein Blc-like [Anopheles bellator]|uniref:outer membrane lipoprotein Blc-like n=1 Tax=Anopheles bellator TaxID=139047 RepID=UPI002647F36F|nr:outer membrane lipoprotein Blc-like [Anopheles bellator]
MAKLHAVALTMWLWIGLANGYVVKDGNCTLSTKGLPVVENFEVQNFTGKWYELERYEQNHERDLECVTTSYRSSEPVGMLEIQTRGYDPSNGTFVTLTNIGAFEELSNSTGSVAKLTINAGKALPVGAEYRVVATDYSNYTIVYGCQPFLGPDQSVEGYWLLSRTPHLTDQPEVLARVNYLRSTFFVAGHIRRTNHSEELCGNEPDLPAIPQSIILPPPITVPSEEDTTSLNAE